MKLRAFAVIDTNVFISSMYSKQGFPFEVCNLITLNNIIPVFDKRMLLEYYKVFNSDKFKCKFTNENIKRTIYNLVNNGIFVTNVKQTLESFIDKTDVPFFEVKESVDDLSPYLITGNIKHYPKDNYVVTPKEFIGIMSYLDKFINNIDEINKNIENIINKGILEKKYQMAENLLNEVFSNVENKEINEEFFTDLSEL